MPSGGTAPPRAARWPLRLALGCLCALHAPHAEARPEGHMPFFRGADPTGGAPERGSVWVFFVNIGRTPLDLSYLAPDGPRFQEQLESETSTRLDTFIGHAFEVAGKSAAAMRARVEIIAGDTSTEEGIRKLVLCEEMPGKAQAVVECRAEKMEYKGAKWENLVAHLKESCSQVYAQHPDDAAYFCHRLDYPSWFMAQCMFEMSPQEFNWRSWQPQQQALDYTWLPLDGVPKFTELGHDVRPIPAELFGALQAHWREGRMKHARPENFPKFDATVGGCASDTWMLKPSPSLFEEVIKTLQPLVAEWAGFQADDIKFTAMYGIRMYRHGSILNMHRDRGETHVLSAILEVGQLDLSHPDPDFAGTQEWPLEIFDHQRNVHKVPNSPGQMIFYESHTCPHGRPTTYHGREVANLFVHFAPNDWGPKDYDPRQRGVAEL